MQTGEHGQALERRGIGIHSLCTGQQCRLAGACQACQQTLIPLRCNALQHFPLCWGGPLPSTALPSLPSFGITLVTVLLPVFLMLLKTFADIAFAEGNVVRNWMDMIGHPITALLLALLPSLYTFGSRQGIHSKQILKLLDASLAPTAAIILIIGAGGGFKQMLVTSGVGDVIGHMAVNAQINPILLAWLVAAVIRIATGSATVATITGAGIVVPVVGMIPGVNRELLVLATGEVR